MFTDMEHHLLRFVILIALFFVLTCDYSAIFKEIISSIQDGVSDTSEAKLDDDGSEILKENHINTYDNSQLKELLHPPDHNTLESIKIRRERIINAVKNSCLPRLICELNASENKENLSQSERGLLTLIRDTSISATAEVTSKYHFAAHMGQLIMGIESTGCHNFYPDCPIHGFRIPPHLKHQKAA